MRKISDDSALVDWYEKEYLCPHCRKLIKKSFYNTFEENMSWHIMTTGVDPLYCPYCGTSLKGSCLFEPIHGRYPDQNQKCCQHDCSEQSSSPEPSPHTAVDLPVRPAIDLVGSSLCFREKR